MSNSTDLIAIIVEGHTERAIMEVLLEHDALKFNEDDLLEGEVIRARNAKKFAKEFLNKGFRSRKVKIYRILDSKTEKFNLPEVYKKKVSEVVELRTRAAIVILDILYYQDYQRYTNNYKSKVKPSDFVKQYYHDLKSVKSYDENYYFWNSHYDDLINVLKQYKQYHSSEKCIADLLKE